MSGSRSPSPPPAGDKKADTPPVRRFMNGWSKEQDQLMADWSDIAGCYRWMHDKAEKQYTRLNMNMTIPVIILSTLTGTASVGLSSIAGGNADVGKYLNFGIGGLSLIAGILTTLNNFLRYAQLSESNRVAAVAWGKFQRLIAVELALNPNERMDSLDFLKICRADLDRLIEQSPAIPDNVIAEFEDEFRDMPKLRRPDICHGLDHTRVFDSTQSRIKEVASQAALHLMHKKKTIREAIVPDLNKLIESAVSESIQKKKEEIERNFVEKPVENTKHGVSSLFHKSNADLKNLLEKRKKSVDENFPITVGDIKVTVDDPEVAAALAAPAAAPAEAAAVPAPVAADPPAPPSEEAK